MMNQWKVKKAIRLGSVLGAALALSGCPLVDQDMSDLTRYVDATKASSTGRELEPLPEAEEYIPFEYTAQERKDPFALSEWMRAATLISTNPEPDVSNGISPDPDRPREELEKYEIGALQMVGTFQNIRPGEDLFALIKAPDGIIHRITEGKYMGTNHGRINNITETRIDLREIVPDEKTGGGWQERDAFLTLAE